MTDIYKKHILVVDDEESIVDSIVAYLDISGFLNIHKAYNGKEAYEVISQNDIDLVVSDVRMPHMDGISLLEETLKHFPGKPIFLMITGYSEISPQKAQEKGARMLLSKPLDFDALVREIEIELTHLK